MRQTVLAEKDPEGVGLAANQVGLDKRIFLAKIAPKSKTSAGSEFAAFINPEITNFSKEMQEEFEGCLSIPDIFGYVKRAQEVTVRYTNTKGQIKSRTFTGLPARIMQHEMDHLNGRLFIDHVQNQSKELYRYLGTNKKGEPEFEKLKIEWKSHQSFILARRIFRLLS